MFETRMVRDAVDTVSSRVEEARERSTIVDLDGSCLIRGGGHVTESDLGVLKSDVVYGVGVIARGIGGVLSGGGVGDGSANLRQNQSAAERRARLNARLVRAGQLPLGRASRWSP